MILCLNLYSLNNYYKNKKNFYFGIEAIEDYLKSIKIDHEIFIHDWIRHSTGSFEYNDQYNYISSLKNDLKLKEIRNENLIFYFGSPKLLK